MQIILGDSGFCNGVERAINIALDVQKKANTTVFTNTELIHNTIVVKDLANKNIIPLKNNQILNNGDIVIISAHGTTRNYIDNLSKIGVNVINAVCPFVEQIHKKVADYSKKEDSSIIIIGDKNHSEVIGIAGWCKSYQVVNSFEEIDFSLANNFLMVEQTTYNIVIYKKIKEKVVKFLNNSSKIVEFFDSICYTTISRQNQSISIAKECDVVLVIGDKNSSNCNKLFTMASMYCNKVILIENVTDLKSIQIKNKITKLGILSSASTPKELTMEVFNRMSSNVNTTTEAQLDEQNDMQENAKVEVATATIAEPTTMEQALASMPSYKKYKPGMKMVVTIVSLDENGINVAMPIAKNDCGFIPKIEAELDGSYDQNNYKINDELEVIMMDKTSEYKNISGYLFSKKKFDLIKLDDAKVTKILEGEDFSLKCTQAVTGGLLGKIGTYTIFVPASQIRMGYVKSLDDYLNKTLKLRVLPPKEELDAEGNPKKPRNPKRIVASQRVILEEEKATRDEEFWTNIFEGAIIHGKVKRFADFGAFVSLKYMDALVHNSDLSWSKKRINNPGEVLEINKAYDFVVLNADRENNKISLGYKQLQKKPYDIAQEKFPVGSELEGKVARVVPFGAFVELEPGIDGLVHVSQIKHGWIQSATEALKEGDIVKVKVMSYENDKITLSMKALLPMEEESEKSLIEEIDALEIDPKDKVSRTQAFKNKFEGLDNKPKAPRRYKREREVNDEPRQYSSSNTGVTLGDLFNLKKDEEES
ncbi:MAG: 4-hydroxy-3-methylbut-2-enyl diphosphate reductase [Clostridia bacterium]